MFWLGSVVNAFTQKGLEKQRNKNQIAAALRQYKLANAWPLDTAPEDIAQTILDSPGNIPVYLVIAPVSEDSEFQKALSDVWGDITNFFSATFRVNSDSPVIIGQYKEKADNNAPAHDYMTIFNGLKSVPTLFLAPFSTMKDSILGITIATWGTDDTQQLPVAQNIELDIKKLYVDEIRKEAAEFVKRCKQGMLSPDDYPKLKNNALIFANERKMLAAGNDFTYLDKTLDFYKDLVPSTSVFISLMKQIIPIVKLFASYIVDTYFVLNYNSVPRFPEIACNIAKNDILPDLFMRGFTEDNNIFRPYKGAQFLNDIFTSYADVIAKNISLVNGVKFIRHFQKTLASPPDYFENVLKERCFPEPLSPTDYSPEQNQMMLAISRIPETEESVHFSRLLSEWRGITTCTFTDGDKLSIAESSEDIYKKAKVCLENREINKAMDLLAAVADEIPQAADELGEIYSNGVYCAKDLNQAVKYFESAHNNGMKIYKKLASCKKQIGMPPSEYRQLLFEGANADDSASVLMLGREYLNDKEFTTAIRVLLPLVKRKNSEALQLLMECLQGLKQAPQKLTELLPILKEVPEIAKEVQKMLLETTKNKLGSFFSRFK